MTTIADIALSKIASVTVLTTSATVGADTTMKPDGSKDGVTRWVDRSSGIEIGFPSFDLSVRKPTSNKSGERTYKVTANIRVPTLEVTSPSTSTGIQPAPTLAYAPSVKIEFSLPARSTLAERDILLSYLKVSLFEAVTASDGTPGALTASPLVEAVRNFDPPYN